MSEEQIKLLQKKLWDVADDLRGKMSADEYKDYILGFIFYKYLSDKFELRANKLLKTEGFKTGYRYLNKGNKKELEYINAIKEDLLKDLGYFLVPEELFGVIVEKGQNKKETKKKTEEDKTENESNFILGDLQKVLKNIENSTMGTDSEDDFDNLFEDLDLNSTKLGKTAKQKNDLIVKVLGHLNQIDFLLESNKVDILGDAYEYLISMFAESAGKKAGEFYTPQQVSEILAKIVANGKTKIKNVYDPTCGSGSLLLRVKRQLDFVGEIYGQELNRTTYNLARMNMIMHDVSYKNFDIKQEDTLEYPQHIDKKFEAIVANPPFSAKWNANELKMSDDRFSMYGKLAPSSKADFAFIQHMIFHLDEGGLMAVVAPHGVLFRGGSEGHIRKFLIKEKNYLDAVIGLPANIFYGTSIPTCILVLKKCRENNNDIFFIDASEDFVKQKNKNILSEEHIKNILDTYKDRKEIEKYSHIATLEEIEENDYNLNIPRYVDTFEEEEEINIQLLVKEIKNIEEESKKVDEEIRAFCKELGIDSPV